MADDKPLAEHAEQVRDQQAWKIIEATLGQAQQEQARSRRTANFWKGLTFAYISVALLLAVVNLQGLPQANSTEAHTALINIQGVIAEDQDANANAVAGALRKAFEDENAKGILLAINSPGGSPVQSGYIYREIKRLKAEHPEKPVIAVISELGASGGYYIASAADEIIADPSSLVGSIGVTASTFGFVDMMAKLGVERRHYTSGENKAFLDPFSDKKPEETEFWQQVLDSTHKQFIAAVEAGRGDRLSKDPSLYTGLIWNGEQALELGLIDSFGSPGQVAREKLEEEIVDYTYKPSPFAALVDGLGVAIGHGISQQLLSAQPSMTTSTQY